MRQLISFEYCSVHGALAAAYTSGSLAAEFGPEQVRVALPTEAEQRGWHAPLLAELSLADARALRFDTRLLAVVPDGDGPAWALLTSHVHLERDAALVVRALSAVLLARPHRRPVLDPGFCDNDPAWIADAPLRAASILVTEDFAAGAAQLAA